MGSRWFFGTGKAGQASTDLSGEVIKAELQQCKFPKNYKILGFMTIPHRSDNFSKPAATHPGSRGFVSYSHQGRTSLLTSQEGLGRRKWYS